MNRTFKSELHEVVFNSKVPARELAELTGKGYTYLANAANECQEESHLRGRDIIALTNATGNYALLDFINHSCGRVAIPIPECVELASTNSLPDNIMYAIEHLGELSKKHREALADNHITRGELQELEGLKFEALKHVLSLLRG